MILAGDPTPEEIMAAVANDRRAAVPVADLAAALKVGPAALAGPLSALAEGGYLERWDEAEGGPAVSLTPAMAQALGLVLDEGSERWMAPGSSPRRRGPVASTLTVTDALDVDPDASSAINRLVDPNAVEPIDQIIASEEVERKVAAYRAPPPAAPAPAKGRRRSSCWDEPDSTPRSLPVPNRLLGSDWIWPVARLPDGTCPVCGTRGLAIKEVCLVCLRSGIDALLGVVAPAAARRAYEPDRRLKGGVGKAPAPSPSPCPSLERSVR